MFQKHMEHQEQWKDFANYLLGRRNLTEFFKYLDVELKEAMENTSGWDIQFNASEYIGEQGCFFWDIPITYTLQARFMHGYVSEFEFGQVRNPNEDGWSGNIELNMKADMTAFQEGWRNCLHSAVQDGQIEAMNKMASSPGGSVTAGMAIYDTMQILSCDVRTYCVGQCASMGAVLLAAGAPGKRFALPNSRIMIHQPWGGAEGTAADIDIQAKEILRLKEMLNKILASHSNQPLKKLYKDTERDFFMSAQEALEYRLIDKVLEPKSKDSKKGKSVK